MPTDDNRDRNRRFAGRKLYVTGAASGIGLAAARLFAQGGAQVALVDINADGLAQAAADMGGHPLVVDLVDGDAIDASVQAAARLMGGLDGVVNCAGIPQAGGLAELEPDVWARVVAINMTAPYRVCRAALPYLRVADGGTIVNIASGAGLLPSSPGASAYAATKAGLITFTKALAAELGPDIRANAVCPGIVDTPMTAPILASIGPAFLQSYVLKRAADPAEIAEAIAFLTSREASFVTGIALAVDGGRTFH